MTTRILTVAPLLTALMINGRVGANNTAELGTMVVTEQIDAVAVNAFPGEQFPIELPGMPVIEDGVFQDEAR